MIGGTEKRAQTIGYVDVIRTKEKSFCIAVDGYSEFWRYTVGSMTNEKGFGRTQCRGFLCIHFI